MKRNYYFLGAPDKQLSVRYLDLVETRLLLIWVCGLPEESLFGIEVRLLDTSTGGVVVATRKLLHLRVTVALSLSGRNSRSRTCISCFKSVKEINLNVRRNVLTYCLINRLALFTFYMNGEHGSNNSVVNVNEYFSTGTWTRRRSISNKKKADLKQINNFYIPSWVVYDFLKITFFPEDS